MAKKRMFHTNIINCDDFIDMPLSTQALYMHLNMNADDEGFINSPKRIQRYIGASDDDAKILIAKGFIIPFESGIIVVTHWKQHNTIQKDRFAPTLCIDEKSMLSVNDKKEYVLKDSICEIDCNENGNILETNLFQDGNADKNRLDKISIDKCCSSIRDLLSDDDINRIRNILDNNINNADDLFDLIDRDYKLKDKSIIDIEQPFKYVMGVAIKKGYITKDEYEQHLLDLLSI